MKFCSLTDDSLICMHNVLGGVCVCTVSVFGVYNNNMCVYHGVNKKEGGGGD